MASITNSWDETLPTATEAANLGDDRIRAEKLDTREREQNGGRYWPSSNAAKSGVNYISPDAFVPNEYTLYGTDLATKKVYTTDTLHRIAPNTQIDGTLTVAGNLVVAQNKKRILTLTASGRGQASSAEPKYKNIPLYVPNGYNGTITEILILRGVASGADNTIDVKRLVAASAFASGTTLGAAPSTGTTILSTTATLAASDYGLRLTPSTSPAISFPSVAGGDILLVSDGGGANGEACNVIVIIELAW